MKSSYVITIYADSCRCHFYLYNLESSSMSAYHNFKDLNFRLSMVKQNVGSNLLSLVIILFKASWYPFGYSLLFQKF